MDALAAVVTLLKPQAIGAKIIHGAGRWAVRYPAFGQASFALVLKGTCRLAVDGRAVMILEAGDFVLFPAMPGFTMASHAGAKPRTEKLAPDGHFVDEVFHGDRRKKPSVSMLGGYFAFDPINESILLDLLPRMLRIRAADPSGGRIVSIMELLQCEAGEKRPGRTLVLTRLVEVLLVEALRSIPSRLSTTGLLAGLRDPQLVAALHGIHTRTAHPWSLAKLARAAAMSRSAFAERFARVVGVTPLQYLLQWRIAVAKEMLTRAQASVAETALAVGYESASGFSIAFSRETGKSPRDFRTPHR